MTFWKCFHINNSNENDDYYSKKIIPKLNTTKDFFYQIKIVIYLIINCNVITFYISSFFSMGWLKKVFKKAENHVKKAIPKEIRKAIPKELRHAVENEIKSKFVPREAKELFNAVDNITQPFDEIYTTANDIYKFTKNFK